MLYDCNPRERIANDESLKLSIFPGSILETPAIQLSGVTQNFWQSLLRDLLTFVMLTKNVGVRYLFM